MQSLSVGYSVNVKTGKIFFKIGDTSMDFDGVKSMNDFFETVLGVKDDIENLLKETQLKDGVSFDQEDCEEEISLEVKI